MRPLYKVRLRFKEIFDTAPTELRPRAGSGNFAVSVAN